MAMSSWCCLKPLPPISDSKYSSTPARTSLLLREEANDLKPCKKRSLPSKVMTNTTPTPNLVFSIACAAVIGLQIISPTATMAMTSHVDQSSWPDAATLEASSNNKNTKAAVRWSEKRRCPPWKTESYETIVPENLPRPTAHRRWEKIAYGGSGVDHVRSGESVDDSPPVNEAEVIIKTKMGCFSM